MKIEFKVTTNSEEINTMLPYTNAIERDTFLFELFHNFFRSYRHLEEDPSLDKIRKDLYELKEKYKVVIE